MSKRTIQTEIDENLEFFKGKLPELQKDHRNRYALLHGQKIIGIYDTIRDAQTTGNTLYPDKMYSVQKVTDTPMELGFFSHAYSLG